MGALLNITASVVLLSTIQVAPHLLDVKKTKGQRKQTRQKGRSLPRPIPKREEGRIPSVRTLRH